METNTLKKQTHLKYGKVNFGYFKRINQFGSLTADFNRI